MLLMTSSTSEVAVCCSSDSVRSRVFACTSSNSRTLPIAITAWSAKVCSRAICFVAERMHFGAAKHDRSNAFAFAQQRHAEDACDGPCAAQPFRGFGKFVAFGGAQIAHVHRRLVDEGAAGGPVAVDRPLARMPDRYRSVMCADAQSMSPSFRQHDRIIGIAKLAGALDNGLEHRPDIGRRGCDHAEDVALPV